MPRTIVIGDVHGCFDELWSLLTAIMLQPSDTVIFTGDLLHKGPHSEKTVQLAKTTLRTGPGVLVMGNHEEKHLRWLRKPVEDRHVMKGVDEYSEIHLDSNHISFLQSGVLWHRIDEHFVVIHGGIPANMQELPGDITKMSGRHRRYAMQLLRVRYINPQGKMVALGNEKKDDVFWAKTYDGCFGTVIFGHQPFEHVARYPHAIGLDTGCCHGNKLSALVIEPEQPTRAISVPAQRIYAPTKRLGARTPVPPQVM